MHSNVTIKNVSWPHFSWATLYIIYHCGHPYLHKLNMYRAVRMSAWVMFSESHRLVPDWQ